MLTPVRELVFVYSSRGGSLSLMADTVKRVLRLNGCPLCEITHGLIGERQAMRECKAEFGVPISYFHWDELPTPMLLACGGKYPAILARTDEGVASLLTPEMIDRCAGSLDELRARLLFQSAARGLDLPCRPGTSLTRRPNGGGVEGGTSS